MDEHALSLNGDAVGVSDMPDCECLGSVNPVNVRARMQPSSKGSAAHITEGQGSRVGRFAWQVRRCAKDMIEYQRAYPAVNHAGRSLIGSAKKKLRLHYSVVIVVNGQGRRHWIADAYDNVARRDGMPVRCDTNTE